MRKIVLTLAIAAIFAANAAIFPQSANAAFGDLSVSQNHVFVNVGQQAVVNLNMSSNQIANIVSITNTAAVNAYISGNQLYIYGVNFGNSQIGVCTTSDQCAYVQVTVGGSNNNGSVSLSQTNLNLSAGQSATVNIFSNFSSSFYISSNSNSNAATAYISNNTINVFANQNGNTTFTICAQNFSGNCATLFVSVSGTSGTISLSQTNVNLNIGQNSLITIFSNNSNSGFYVSSNTNSFVANPIISGNTLNIYANQNGSTNITVCSSAFSGNCATVFVSVSGVAGNITLTPSSLNLNPGQNGFVTLGGNYGTAYVSSNSNSYVATANITNNQVNVYANQNGTTSIVICGSNYGTSSQCATLFVNVNANNNNNCYPYNCAGSLFFPTTNLPQAAVGQYYNQTIQVSGGSSPYSFSIYSGTLPPGLTLNYNGTISGVPTQNGNYSFTVRAADNFNRVGISNTMFVNVGGVAGASLYNNGTLIKENGTIYIVYKSTKSGFTNFAAFSGFGFKTENVLQVASSGLFESGHLITTSNTSHPWGSWINNNGTIYFVHESGLIPVPTYDIFKNNGGQDHAVVPANIYDFNRPVLQLMSHNDTRLK